MKVAFYKSTRPGLPGLYNRLIRWFERGPYSHCEIIFYDGWAASSSAMDGGVWFKRIEFNPEHWDFIEISDSFESGARKWFYAHAGKKYDYIGNVRFMLGWLPDGKDRYFCSEAIAAALELHDPWRYGPNALYAALKTIEVKNDTTR